MTDRPGQDRDERSGDRGLASRVLKALSILFGVHLEFAQREAKDDLGRIAAGLMLLVAGALFVLFALGLGELAAVLWVHRARGLPYSSALLVVAATDAALALLCLLVARARLRKPILRETRGLVKRTVGALTD